MIPMVSPDRLPDPGYEVIYSGSLEAERIRAQQREPPALPRFGLIHGESREHLLTLMAKTPARVWSLQELVDATGRTYSAINSLVAKLRRRGEVDVTIVAVTGRGHGRQLRVWLAR
jgi:hypothetical protein